jgi:nicotinamidase-related amidase
MSETAKPWDGLIPGEDVESFGRGFARQQRPVSAGTRPALIVVDMTLAFVDSTYPSGHSETGYPAVAANRTLLDVARAARLPIYFTKGYADPDYEPSAAERGPLSGEGGGRRALPKDTPPGDVIVGDLTPLENEIVIHKGGKRSAFFGTPLASYLIYEGCDTAVITGMTTSGCVRATVVDAFQHNFRCVIPYECVADRSQISHKVNLFDMHMKYGDVVSLAETIAYIEKITAG